MTKNMDVVFFKGDDQVTIAEPGFSIKRMISEARERRETMTRQAGHAVEPKINIRVNYAKDNRQIWADITKIDIMPIWVDPNDTCGLDLLLEAEQARKDDNGIYYAVIFLAISEKQYNPDFKEEAKTCQHYDSQVQGDKLLCPDCGTIFEPRTRPEILAVKFARGDWRGHRTTGGPHIYGGDPSRGMVFD